MSKIEYDAYCQLYQKLLAELINLHNYHITYKQRIGFETGLDIRRSAKAVSLLAKQLGKQTIPMYKEKVKNTAERLAKEREEKEIRRQKRKEKLAQNALKNNKKGTKSEQHNNTNANNV